MTKTKALAEIRLGILTAKLHVSRMPLGNANAEQIMGWIEFVNGTMPTTELAITAYIRYVEAARAKHKNRTRANGFH